MTYLANIPRVPRKTRLLTEDELSPWAVKRGQFNDAIEADEEEDDGLPVVTVLVAALIGAGIWLMIIHAVYAAFTVDLSLVEF